MRTRQEIDQEYSQLALQYGDRMFKISLLQTEAKAMFEKMSSLNQEPAGPASAPTEVKCEAV